MLRLGFPSTSFYFVRNPTSGVLSRWRSSLYDWGASYTALSTRALGAAEQHSPRQGQSNRPGSAAWYSSTKTSFAFLPYFYYPKVRLARSLLRSATLAVNEARQPARGDEHQPKLHRIFTPGVYSLILKLRLFPQGAYYVRSFSFSALSSVKSRKRILQLYIYIYTYKKAQFYQTHKAEEGERGKKKRNAEKWMDFQLWMWQFTRHLLSLCPRQTTQGWGNTPTPSRLMGPPR